MEIIPYSDWTEEKKLLEINKCSQSAGYFIDTYCRIYEATLGQWVPFKLWPGQFDALEAIEENDLTVILKARQLGLTWLALAYLLWLMIFKPIASVMIFSRRDDESKYLLGSDRLKGMFRHLPDFLKTKTIEINSSHEFKLSNGSVARAFPTSAGDSYTSTAVLIDEADLIEDLGALLKATKPTIDGGGKLIMISRVDKAQPESEFKKIYRAAVRKENSWKPIFLGWFVRLNRTVEWYERIKADILSRHGVLDELHEQYPATPEEALAPKSLDKRIPPRHLSKVYEELEPLSDEDNLDIPSIPGLNIYALPTSESVYAAGADPAEGNPNSDDSSLSIMNAVTGEEVCQLAGKFDPSTFASYIDEMCRFYNNAPVLPERNNHGHAIILWLTDNSSITVMEGRDGSLGWPTNSLSKALMYTDISDAIRKLEVKIHDSGTYFQLGSIQGSTLKAPKNMNDDKAVSFVLAYQCALLGVSSWEPFIS